MAPYMRAVAIVVGGNVEKDRSPIEDVFELPGTLSVEDLPAATDQLTAVQRAGIVLGLKELRQAYSRALITHLRLVRINPDGVSRFDVMSEDNRDRLLRGEPVIALEKRIDFQGRGAVGRPDATPVEHAFKRALAQAVARIDHLALAADPADADAFYARRTQLGQRLQTHAPIFNLNAGHERQSPFPVLSWCENNGGDLIARAYEMERAELEAALLAAFADRLRREGFDDILAREIAHIETLLSWISAYRARKEGEASRRDTLRRAMKSEKLDWDSAPGTLEPPKMRKPVREALSGNRLRRSLSNRSMLDVSMLFELEPAYDVLLTRLYLEPLLLVAGLIGQVGLRRQTGLIESPIVAGALVALVDERGFANDDVTGPDGADAHPDEIAALQMTLEVSLEGLGLSLVDLEERGRRFLETGRPVTLRPLPGPPRFFVEP